MTTVALQLHSVEILRGFDSRRLHTPRKTSVSDRNDSDVSTRILVEGAQRRLEVAGIKVGVDVRGGADIGVAGEHLCASFRFPMRRRKSVTAVWRASCIGR